MVEEEDEAEEDVKEEDETEEKEEDGGGYVTSALACRPGGRGLSFAILYKEEKKEEE